MKHEDDPFTVEYKKGGTPSSEMTYIAGYIPEDLAQKFSLWATYNGVPRVSLIQEAIQRILVPIDAKKEAQMLADLAERAATQWNSIVLKTGGKKAGGKKSVEAARRTAYFQELAKSLHKRGLSRDHIKKIMTIAETKDKFVGEEG